MAHLPAGITGSGKTAYSRRLEAAGVLRLSVLDYGLWRRAEREECKRLVVEAGGRWRLIHFEVGRIEMLRRLGARDLRTHASALTVTPEALEEFYDRFEEPCGEGEEIVTP